MLYSSYYPWLSGECSLAEKKMVVKREDKETKYHHHYHSQKKGGCSIYIQR